MSVYHGTIVDLAGGPHFQGNFTVPGGVYYEVNGSFISSSHVPTFFVPKTTYEYLPSDPSSDFTGFIGPTELYLQFDDRPEATVTGDLEKPINEKIIVKGILGYFGPMDLD